jgi:hypothetical protein
MNLGLGWGVIYLPRGLLSFSVVPSRVRPRASSWTRASAHQTPGHLAARHVSFYRPSRRAIRHDAQPSRPGARVLVNRPIPGPATRVGIRATGPQPLTELIPGPAISHDPSTGLISGKWVLVRQRV